MRFVCSGVWTTSGGGGGGVRHWFKDRQCVQRNTVARSGNHC